MFIIVLYPEVGVSTQICLDAFKENRVAEKGVQRKRKIPFKVRRIRKTISAIAILFSTAVIFIFKSSYFYFREQLFFIFKSSYIYFRQQLFFFGIFTQA